ncbi:MAG: PTS sugar transporter subunit IIA [Oscillospiraceae bacterium]|nr:PTS sugar transporter subunit IIA [Oscillospiraceae bacterium]
MSDEIKITEECIDLNVTAANREEVLEHLVALLEKQGFVDTEYTKKILEREKNYPTGLCFSKIKIAIPHGDPQYVNESSIAIGRCINKPMFGSMEDPSEQVGVDIVVLLAVKDPESHLTILNNLMEMFTIEKNCEVLISGNSNEEVCQLFKKCLYEKN